MLNYLVELTQLTQMQFWFSLLAVFIAGLVRGFAGFALSAIVVASMASILPTRELIPMAYLLEGSASLVMLRGGVRDADMSIVWVLAIGSAIGVPIGLLATTSLPMETTRIVALVLILCLAALQLFKISPRFVGTRAGLYGTGLFAGIATGLASVGGMVVALYILASKFDPRSMRGALVMYLFVGMFTSLVWHLLYGIMDMRAVMRGVVFAPVLLLGVFIGVSLFRPSLQGFYKRFCLVLLMGLSVAGLVSALT
tara:strand:- start:10491 stop:11252 length:762 start_codon:yes stop_codon:yes gene_type:complete